VLIHGDAGGVGHFAIQFAEAVGAHVMTSPWRPLYCAENGDELREIAALSDRRK
jgi:NADPH:quinone reductase-like Zn-dependent oxidoreductase